MSEIRYEYKSKEQVLWKFTLSDNYVPVCTYDDSNEEKVKIKEKSDSDYMS